MLLSSPQDSSGGYPQKEIGRLTGLFFFKEAK
jgi:hypothetical protein